MEGAASPVTIEENQVCIYGGALGRARRPAVLAARVDREGLGSRRRAVRHDRQDEPWLQVVLEQRPIHG